MLQGERAKTLDVAAGKFLIFERNNWLLFDPSATYLYVSIKIICSVAIPLQGNEF